LIFGPLLFLVYINDLPKIINKDTNMVLYADDTSIMVADSNNSSFETNLNQTIKDINAWINANLLNLNFSKTQYLVFQSTNFCNIATHINYDQTSISNVSETKFLGSIIDDMLS
jgi:hypothetical protein